MKTMAECETSKSTLDMCKLLQVATPSIAHFEPRAPAGRGSLIMLFALPYAVHRMCQYSVCTNAPKAFIMPPLRPHIEQPDFTEADKEWIDKIDRTQLSWDDWD